MATIKAKLEADGTVLVRRPGTTFFVTAPRRTDWSKFDATTEAEIERQAEEDDAEALRGAVK